MQGGGSHIDNPLSVHAASRRGLSLNWPSFFSPAFFSAARPSYSHINMAVGSAAVYTARGTMHPKAAVTVEPPRKGHLSTRDTK